MPEKKKRILVIDDEEDVCHIIKEKFIMLGYEVTTAPEGGEGFEKTLREKPDAVLLDIRIPKGEDGLTYLRELRTYRHQDPQEQSRIRSTPVVILTATGTSMQPVFESEGISGFIEKPFDVDDLYNKVRKVLEKA